MSAKDLLVLETGAIVTGANSYADLTMGNAYHATRLYSDAWVNANDDLKAQALMMATATIDANTAFEGKKRHFTQPLCWPRVLVPNDDSLFAGYPDAFFISWSGWGYGSAGWGGWCRSYLPNNIVAPQVIAATCQMALELLARNRTAEDPTTGIKSLGIGQGAISITFDASDRRAVIPDTVRVYLLQLGEIRGPNSMQKKIVRVQ